MSKVLKQRKNLNKNPSPNECFKTPGGTVNAWETSLESYTPTKEINKEKPSRLSKLFNKKKAPNNLVEEFAINENVTVMYDAFQERNAKNIPRSAGVKERIRKSSSTNTFPITKDNSRTNNTNGVISQSDMELNDGRIVTVLSSDSSSHSESETETSVPKIKAKLKKPRIKSASSSNVKEKSSKNAIQNSEVIYLQRDDKTSSDTIQDIPWNVVSYNPLLHHDYIIDSTLTVVQFINLLTHTDYSDKIAFIDLRSYDEYCKEAVLGTSHYSDFQNNNGQFSMEKIVKKYKAIVFLTCDDSEVNISTNAIIHIFRLNDSISSIKEIFPFFLARKSSQQTQNWPPISCFDNGSFIFCEDFSSTIKWVSKFASGVIITNASDQICAEMSQQHSHKLPTVVSVKITELNLGDYSDKKIVDSDLMKVMDKVSGAMTDDVRCVIIVKEDSGLQMMLLTLCLILKNHWALKDTLTYIEFVRCQDCNLKPNQLSVLKSFEKLFFGKRLYSGNSKEQRNQRYAFAL